MSDAISRRDRELGNVVPGPHLDDYAERLRPHFHLERHDGVLTIRMLSHLWSRGLLNAWNHLLREAGADRANEVVVITGTGDAWLTGAEPSSFAEPMSRWDSDLVTEQYQDGVRILERLVLDIGVPTIAALNGPGFRQEIPLLCDLTICTPDVVFGDGNFRAGSVPGDGMYLVLRELAGPKRAGHVVYTGQGIPAAEAQTLGVVNEVVERAQLMPRALELAAQIMARPRTTRHLTHDVLSRSWQRTILTGLRDAYAHQLLAMTTESRPRSADHHARPVLRGR